MAWKRSAVRLRYGPPKNVKKMTNEEITIQALNFAKKNKLRIAKELTDVEYYKPALNPVSVFMAGSPGAGKTEFSKHLIELLGNMGIFDVVRIDGDEIRQLLPGYTGNNSHLFQGAISLVVEKLHDLVLHQHQNFILDGTFANYLKAKENIERSLNKNRRVFVFYVYQEPKIAWKFTQAREKAEGRNIPKIVFINQFLGAKETVANISEEFGNRLIVRVVIKNLNDNTVKNVLKFNSTNGKIDDYLGDSYTRSELERII